MAISWQRSLLEVLESLAWTRCLTATIFSCHALYCVPIKTCWPIVPLPLLSGSRRFNKLKAAASGDNAAPPADLRFLTKPANATEPSEERASVVSFLQQICSSVAETLPDYRDETYDVDTTLFTMSGDKHENDPYFDQLEKGEIPVSGPHERKKDQVGKQKKKKTRKMKRTVKMNLSRNVLYEDRWLPPGQMKDYWEQYRHSQAGARCASFTTFWREARFTFSTEVCHLLAR